MAKYTAIGSFTIEIKGHNKGNNENSNKIDHIIACKLMF